ncbi:glycosyltransferase family 4 protein [Neobacillus vireti]|uniref:glycosyltransferase family 4 protein n=1 Tax=Neobacillus vireti TaxID=220686 RepID=UPI002FFFCC5B
MAKVLVTAHLGRHFRIFGHYDYKVLLSMGHEVHIAANFSNEIDEFSDPDVIQHQIDFDRNPFSKNNLMAKKQLEKLFNEQYFDMIHCQSPSGGAITRLAARKTRKKGTKIIYTAHGFHFFKGSPKKNWLIYFNIEKFLSYFTDTIITINDEDFKVAKDALPVKNVRYIHGIGIDLEKFKPQTNEIKTSLRKEYGYNDEDFILIYAGELSHRKHQDLIIDAISLLKSKIPNIKVLLAGVGILEEQYKQQVLNLGLEENINFLQYRKDIKNLMLISDLAVSASRQEGLPVNVMEAMATGLPLVVTNCRGNRDLVKNNIGGYVLEINDVKGFSDAIKNLYFSKELREKLSQANLEIINDYSLVKVRKEMIEIYQEYLH